MPSIFIDVRDDPAAQAEGEKAEQKAEGVNPEIYRERARDRAAVAFDRYELWFASQSNRVSTRRVALMEKAAELKKEGKDLEAGATFAKAQTLAAAGGLFEGSTAIIRPYNLPRSIKTVADTVRDPEKLNEAVTEFQKDPLKTYIAGPSMFLGGQLAGQGIQYIGRRAGLIRPRYSEPVPVESQLLYESELGYQYPQEVTSQHTTFRGFETMQNAGIVDDGFMSSRLQPRGTYRKSGFKGFGRTGGELIPVEIPETAPLMPVYKPIIDVETSFTYVPGYGQVPGVPVYNPSPISSGLGILGLTRIASTETQPTVTEVAEQTSTINKVNNIIQINEATQTIEESFNRGAVRGGGLNLMQPIKIKEIPATRHRSTTTDTQIEKQATRQAQRVDRFVIPRSSNRVQTRKVIKPKIGKPATLNIGVKGETRNYARDVEVKLNKRLKRMFK